MAGADGHMLVAGRQRADTGRSGPTRQARAQAAVACRNAPTRPPQMRPRARQRAALCIGAARALKGAALLRGSRSAPQPRRRWSRWRRPGADCHVLVAGRQLAGAGWVTTIQAETAPISPSNLSASPQSESIANITGAITIITSESHCRSVRADRLHSILVENRSQF